jgi:hypothetical protein
MPVRKVYCEFPVMGSPSFTNDSYHPFLQSRGKSRRVYIPELTYPGVWLEGLAPEESHQVQTLLFMLESAIADTALSLTMFEAEAARPRRSGKDQWEADRAREATVSSNCEQQLPTGLSDIARWQALDSLREQIRIDAKRLKWASGEMPETYYGRLQLLHAKSFVYALDNLERTIASLAKVNGARQRWRSIGRS